MGMTVLVADDSAAIVERVTEIVGQEPELEIAGQAKDIAECLALVRALHPKVIILDLEMPGGSGLDVLRAIQGDWCQPITIVLTNSSSIPVRKACLKAGARFFLDKSNDFNQLPRILSRIVHHKVTVRRSRSAPKGNGIRHKATM